MKYIFVFRIVPGRRRRRKREQNEEQQMIEYQLLNGNKYIKHFN